MKVWRRSVMAGTVAVAIVVMAVIGFSGSAVGQAPEESTFTGTVLDSFGAKVEATAGLAFDPIFAYAQGLVIEPAPIATGHGYVVFPGIVAASTIITCCGASPDFPRFGGRLPTETICGDPGQEKVSEPEVRNPRNWTSQSPYNTNCDPGSSGCDIIRRGNATSSSDPSGRWAVASGYGRTECNVEKMFAFTDQRAQNVQVLPMAGSSSSASEGSDQVEETDPSVLPELPGVSSPEGQGPAASAPKQASTVYAISMGSVTTFSKTEMLGAGLTGAPARPAVVDTGESSPIAATGSPTKLLRFFGFLALAAGAAGVFVARRLGRTGAAAVIMILLLALLLVSGPAAQGQEPRKIVSTVDSRANDVVITAGVVELLRIAEVRVVAVAETTGRPGGAKTLVRRTVRGVKALGQEQSDVSNDRINQLLAASGLSIKLGNVKESSSPDGTDATVDATGIVLEQKMAVPGVGGVQFPEYRLTLARATPGVSFYTFSVGGLEDFGGPGAGSFGGGEFTPGDTTGPAAPAFAGAAGTPEAPVPTGVPGVSQIGPGKFLVSGDFVGFDWKGMKIRLWPLKDILEAMGGALIIGGLFWLVAHRRRHSLLAGETAGS